MADLTTERCTDTFDDVQTLETGTSRLVESSRMEHGWEYISGSRNERSLQYPHQLVYMVDLHRNTSRENEERESYGSRFRPSSFALPTTLSTMPVLASSILAWKAGAR